MQDFHSRNRRCAIAFPLEDTEPAATDCGGKGKVTYLKNGAAAISRCPSHHQNGTSGFPVGSSSFHGYVCFTDPL